VCYDTTKNEWLVTPSTPIYDTQDVLDSKTPKHVLFDDPSSHTINLQTGSKTAHSYEVVKFWKYRVASLESDDVYVEHTPTLLGALSCHRENVGHVLFDSYLSILSTINNWFQCGIDADSVFDVVLSNSKHSHFDRQIGSALFHDMYALKTSKARADGHRYVCYENLMVGTGNQKNLFGGVDGKQRMLRFMRSKILYHYGYDPLWTPHSNDELELLVLIKNTSSWKHKNWPGNLDSEHSEVVHWINDEYVATQRLQKLTALNPAFDSFEQILDALSTASIVMCMWGGIGLTNFLAPIGAVEIIFTTWDERMHYTPDKVNETVPDFEYAVRNAITDQQTLRYWDSNATVRIEKIEKSRLFNLLDVALEMVQSTCNLPICEL